jgi:hypothetical protein
MQDEITIYRLIIFLLKGWKVPIFENNHKESFSVQEEIKSRECLLSFGAESFVFQYTIQK